MKILMVTPLLPHPGARNAGPLVMHARLSGLASHHQVTLATFAGPAPHERDAIDRLRASGVDVHVVWRSELSAARRWQRRGRMATSLLFGGYPLRVAHFWEPAMQRLLDHLLAAVPFDVVHVEDSAMGAYRYRTRAPTVLAELEVTSPNEHALGRSTSPHLSPEAGCLTRLVGRLERWRWGRYQPAAWRRFDRIQVFTRRDAGSIRGLAPDLSGRIRVNPFGVDVSPPVDPGREQPASVVFVGGFLHPPNVDAALWIAGEIMPALRPLAPGVRLTIVGSNPPPVVRALACDDVVVTGPVPEVEPFLDGAAVVLAPVRTGGGMRMKVLQAMARTKAVVTTSLGAEGLAADSAPPPVAIAEDARGLAAAVARLLSTPSERRALGRRARAFVAVHHTWSAHVERLEAIYRELVTSVTTPLAPDPSR